MKIANQKSGVTIVEVIFILFVIAILAFFLLAVFAKARFKTSKVACVNNFKNVVLAYRIFTSDNSDRFPFELSTNQGGS